MKISAFFDNVDMAEWAVVRLREGGITPKSYNVARESSGRGVSDWDSTIAFPVVAPGINAASPEMGGIGTNPWLPLGVMAMTGDFGTFVGGEGSDRHSSDVTSDEARLYAELEPSEADLAKSIIISNHGRRVKVSS